VPDVIANGIRIHYERTGGNKPALVLLHGFSDSGECWPRVIASLKKDYDIVTADARAHGRSEGPASGYTRENMAADVAELCATLGLKKPAFVGHSMGGGTAALLGAMYPDLARCLVLEDPPFLDRVPSQEEQTAELKRQRDRLKALLENSAEQLVAENKETAKGEREWAEIEYKPWVESKKQLNMNIGQLWRSPQPRWQGYVSRITCPTLLVTADPAKGALVTQDVAKEVLALNRHFQVANFPKAGHNIRRESYTEFIAAVTAFLASVPA
jgi:N-formylmaleamate deformylase